MIKKRSYLNDIFERIIVLSGRDKYTVNNTKLSHKANTIPTTQRGSDPKSRQRFTTQNTWYRMSLIKLLKVFQF